MPIKLSHNIENIPPSATMLMTQLARDLKSEGKNIISMSAGEPDFDTPQNIKEAAINAIKRGETKYTAVDGIDDLKEAVINKFKLDNNLDYTRDNISVAPGGKSIIFNAILSTVNPGDEVLIPAPYWVSYPDIVKLAGGTPVIIKTSSDNNFKISPDDLEKNITDKTKWLFLNSPSNPTVQVYSEDELKNLAEIIKKHKNLYVLSDDIYEYIIYDDFKFYTLAQVAPDLKNRILTVNGVSKSYCMTGWRIGYAAGRKDLILAMMKIQGQSTSNPTSISQYAALAGLNGDRKFLEPCLKAFNERKNLVVEGLNSIDGISCLMPKGAFYAYPNVSGLIGKKTKNGKSLSNDTEVVEWILEEAKVAAVPGSAFGLEPYFRVSYATSTEDLKIAIQNLKNSVSELT